MRYSGEGSGTVIKLVGNIQLAKRGHTEGGSIMAGITYFSNTAIDNSSNGYVWRGIFQDSRKNNIVSVGAKIMPCPVPI